MSANESKKSQSARARNLRSGSRRAAHQARQLFFEGLEVRSLLAVVPFADNFTVNEGAGNLVGNVVVGDGLGGADHVGAQNGPLQVSLFGAPLGGLTLNNDGSFVFSNTGDGTSTFTFQYTVEDDDNVVSVPATVTITVNNVAPTAVALSGPANLITNASGPFSFTGPTDVTADTSGPNPLRYSFATSPGALAADYVAAAATNSASISFPTTGNFSVYGKVYDKDGGISGLFQTNVTVVAPPSMTATLVAGNLVITDTDAGGKNNNITVAVNAGTLTVSDASETFVAAPAGWTLAPDGKSISITAALFTGTINVNGAGGDDKLQVNATDLTNVINYDGGLAGNDTLAYNGGGAADVRLGYGNTFTALDKSGTVSIGATLKVNYSNLAPVDITNIAGALTFNLPAVTDPDAVISFDGANIVLTGSSFELTSVALAGVTSVTVNGKGGNDNITVDATYTAAQPPLDINTNGGTDTITLNGVARNVNTGAANDSITVNTGTATSIDGGADTNTLKLTGIANAAVTVSAVDATGADGTETTKTINFSNIKTLTSDGTGSLTGTNSASTWIIDDGATNTYATDLTFSGFKTLTGGNGVDTFNVRNNSGAIAYTLNGGAGLDQFNFGSANSLANISKNISVNGDADSATLTLNDQAVPTNLNYTAGMNTIGRDTGGTVTYSAVTDLTLNASNGSNTIKITAVPAATGTKTFNGGTGDDVLDITGLAANAVVSQPNATKGFDGTVTGVASFTGIESFKGNNASTFVGDDEAATWTINDSGTNTYVSQSRTANITGFNTLQGGSKVDAFNVLDNSGALAYTLKGGAGLDAFNFGNANSLAAISKNIAVDGEVDSATLTLNDQGVPTNLDYTAGANTIGRDTGGTVTYSAVTNLTLNASNGSNTIKIAAAPTATGTKTFNGGTGNDVLDLSLLAASKVTLTGLTIAPATTGFDGNIDGVANFTGVEEIKASAAGVADELIGLNAASTWVVNDPVGNTYATTRTLKWSAFENLTGNAAADTYKIQNNSTSNTLTLTGNAGADKFLIGDTVNKLVGVKNLNVVGGADVGDELTLNDQAEGGASDYTITATTATDVGGVVVSHTTVENITLNASNGANAISVIDGAFNPATTIKLVDTAGASTLAVDDTADAGNNTWTISSSQVVRTSPVPSLTIDYSSEATLTSLNFSGGSAVDTVSVNSTKVATSVTGNAGNDVFSVGGGNLNNFLGQLTINGGTHDLVDTRTVFKGGLTPGPADIVFTATSSVVAKGDTLTVNDGSQAGVTKYAVNNTTVSRTGASKSVSYSNIELLNVTAGSGDSDVLINLPTAAPDLPFVVSINGGGGTDNRVQIKGTDAVDAITVGNGTAVETNRSQFEVTGISRLWIEGGKNADVIHNRSTVPGLLDGGYAKSTATIDAGDQNDVIASDALSTTTLSPVLLGNDGKDFLYTTNNSAAGTTYLVGDYFVNNNVALTAGSASKTSRLQVVAGPGQAGDRYVTNHTPATALKNRVLARLDSAAGSYSGRFANLTADTIGNTLGVIEWLRGRLPLTVSAAGMAGELSRINFFIRQFIREPGSLPLPPAFPNATYNPGGVASGGSFNGGEAVDEDVEPAPLVQNPFDAGDVDGDGMVTAIDALIVINELNRNGAHQLDRSPNGEFGVNGGGETSRPLDFLDVNGDSSISAFDALLIINRLNSTGATAYQQPNPLDWFVESDAAEQAAADFAESQLGQAMSMTDEALLALLSAAGEDDGESSL